MATSFSRIVTGSWLIFSTQACSQLAGQMRPVNSGKLFVAASRMYAPFQSPLYNRSFHSGIRLSTGQLQWQNGIPQSMQREACSFRSSLFNTCSTSLKSFTRSFNGRLPASFRLIFKNPLGSAIIVFVLILIQPSGLHSYFYQ